MNNITELQALNAFTTILSHFPELKGPKLVFTSDIPKAGRYSRDLNQVMVNLNKVENKSQLIQVLAHELFHGYDLNYDSQDNREVRASLFQFLVLGYFTK